MFITNAWAASDSAAKTDETHSSTQTVPGAEQGGSFPPFDTNTFASQLLWLAITFGLFYFIMAKVVIPRISGILEVRKDRISRDLDEANRLKEESDAAIAAYEQELAQARANANDIGQKARDKAKAAADEKREQADAALAKKLAESEAKISDIRAKAMGEVGTIASDVTTSIVKELIGGTLGKADVSKAISSLKN